MWMNGVKVCDCMLCFFKQKTAYELRISDWSSDVCSSDLPLRGDRPAQRRGQRNEGGVAAEDRLRLADQPGAFGGVGRGGRFVDLAPGVCVAECVGAARSEARRVGAGGDRSCISRW